MSVYDPSDSIIEDRINRLFKNTKKNKSDMIFDIVSLVMYSTFKNKELAKLYKVLDLDSFVSVIKIMDGTIIKFPKKKDLEESFILSIIYYYKEVLGLSWDQIKEKVPFEISTISYGIKIKSLDNFIKQKINELFKDMEEIKWVRKKKQ